MKKILFPTDFSPAADHAFIYALQVAAAIDAAVLVVHIYELPNLKKNLPNTIRELYESIEKEAYQEFQDNLPHLDAIAAHHQLSHIPVSYSLKEGDTLETIDRIARQEKIDFIIMGTKGASGLKEVFIGSVAAEIMENAPCPVMAIPEEAVFDGKLDHIAFTTDFKEEDTAALKNLLHFASTFSAKVYCINVDISHTEFYLKRMDQVRADFAGTTNLECRMLKGSSIEAAVTDFMEEAHIDILAMVTQKRNFIQELFHYSQTKQMAYHSKVPVLALQTHSL